MSTPLLDDEPLTVPTEAIALTGVSAGVTASAELVNHTWGVELLLTVTGLDAGRPYDVSYRTVDGENVAAGSFVGVETEQLCRMTGSVLRDDVESIEVLDRDGTVVLRSVLYTRERPLRQIGRTWRSRGEALSAALARPPRAPPRLVVSADRDVICDIILG